MGPRDYNLIFAAAGTQLVEARARYVHVLRAPSASVFLTIDDGQELERIAGEGIFVGEGFKLVKVRATVAQTVKIMIADEPQVTGGGAGTTASVPSTVTVAARTTLVSTASAALATGNSLDISANLSRKRLTICNESTSAGAVWVRDQAATVNGGVELQPGQSTDIDNTAAVRVRNNSGVSANISTNEET